MGGGFLLTMNPDLFLRRKVTLRAHGRQVVFVKRPVESAEHVLMKAFLWALYLPDYPDLSVETPLGDRYKPDVVSLGADGQPLFWGESGRVSREKIASLARRYRGTHFAIAKWAMRLGPYEEIVREAVEGLTRTAPFDLLSVPSDAAERFIHEDGTIHISHDDLASVRIG